VGHGQDQNGSIQFSIYHQELKTGKLEFARASRRTRPAMWRFEDSVDRLIEFGDKSCCGQGLRSRYQFAAEMASSMAAG
jgi:hypothetical protein